VRTCNAPPTRSQSIPALRYLDGLTSNFNGEFMPATVLKRRRIIPAEIVRQYPSRVSPAKFINQPRDRPSNWPCRTARRSSPPLTIWSNDLADVRVCHLAGKSANVCLAPEAPPGAFFDPSATSVDLDPSGQGRFAAIRPLKMRSCVQSSVPRSTTAGRRSWLWRVPQAPRVPHLHHHP
jgi:hypothetical protein